MRSRTAWLAWALASVSAISAKDTNIITLAPAATGFEADGTAFYYASNPLVLVNDGSAADGGFRIFRVGEDAPWTQTTHRKTGRSKIITPVHDVGGRDILLNIAAPDSILRAFEVKRNGFAEVKGARKKILGDWSTLCVWRSGKSGEQYGFLFGKKQVVQLLIRGKKKDTEILEVGHSSSRMVSVTDASADSDISHSNRRGSLHRFLQRPGLLFCRGPTTLLLPGHGIYRSTENRNCGRRHRSCRPCNIP